MHSSIQGCFILTRQAIGPSLSPPSTEGLKTRRSVLMPGSYGERVNEIEHGSFTPLVFSTLDCIHSHLSPFFLLYNYCPVCIYRHIARCVFTTIIMNKILRTEVANHVQCQWRQSIVYCVEEMDGYPEIGDAPFQPRSHDYPKRAFGVSQVVFRAFLPSWYDNYPWLHWDMKRERVFCFTCVKAARGKLLFNTKTDAAFISTGFQNWKDGPRGFSKHQSSDCHKEAVEKLVTIPETTGHVGELLNSQLSSDRKENRENFLLILRNIKFLARQGLPLRGASQDGGEVDSNFHQLLTVFSEFQPSLQKWLEKKKGKYTSADMQNEMLKVMALQILRGLARSIGESKFAIMVDETTDSSCTEQCVIVIRWVDSELQVHEEFCGFYAIATANADTIVSVIKDALLRMNLKLECCRGQCYDGASTMKGSRTGVATQILAEEPRALIYSLL